VHDATPEPCPCGEARRILTRDDNDLLSVHVVAISSDSAAHYHRRTTETYFVLEGEGSIELDGRREPIGPGSVVHIPAGVRHRAVGRLRILNIVQPPFDPADEFLDE
jgi:mannose-6-phosphate isomerase-like protein (cupin superfamily)